MYAKLYLGHELVISIKKLVYSCHEQAQLIFLIVNLRIRSFIIHPTKDKLHLSFNKESVSGAFFIALESPSDSKNQRKIKTSFRPRYNRITEAQLTNYHHFLPTEIFVEIIKDITQFTSSVAPDTARVIRYQTNLIFSPSFNFFLLPGTPSSPLVKLILVGADVPLNTLFPFSGANNVTSLDIETSTVIIFASILYPIPVSTAMFTIFLLATEIVSTLLTFMYLPRLSISPRLHSSIGEQY